MIIFGALVVFKWSARSSSSLTIRIRIPLRLKFLLRELFIKNENKRQMGMAYLKKNDDHFVHFGNTR